MTPSAGVSLPLLTLLVVLCAVNDARPMVKDRLASIIAATSNGRPLRTPFDRLTTSFVVSMSAADGVDDGGPSDDDTPPLLPPTFQATEYLMVNGFKVMRCQIYFDYPGQRYAVYCDTNWAAITLCKRNVRYQFNDTVCEHQTVQCNISRSYMPSDAVNDGSFRLGSSAKGLPVQQWSYKSGSFGYDVLVERDNSVPVQLIMSDDEDPGVIVEDFADVKLTIDGPKFTPPDICF